MTHLQPLTEQEAQQQEADTITAWLGTPDITSVRRKRNPPRGK